jgi:hypothetical protein
MKQLIIVAYTSMLRITTNPPKEDKPESAPIVSPPPTKVVVPADADANPSANVGSTLTGIASALKPNFLRGLSNSRPSTAGGGGTKAETGTTGPDLERGEGSGVVMEQMQSRPTTAGGAAVAEEGSAGSGRNEASEPVPAIDHDDASTAASFETAPLVESGAVSASLAATIDTKRRSSKDEAASAASSEPKSAQTGDATTSTS